MAKWTELKSGDRVVWERTDGVKFLGTVQGVSLHEVDVELDRYVYGLLENNSTTRRQSIDSRQLSLAIHGEPAMQQNAEHLAWEARRMAVEVCKKRGQPLDPFQEVLIQDAMTHVLLQNMLDKRP